MSRSGDVVVLLVTVLSLEVGERIVAAAVPERLAACVNILPGSPLPLVLGEGRGEDEREVLLLIKTRSDPVPALEAWSRAFHPHSAPEFVALPVAAGHEPYPTRVSDSVTTKGGGTSDQE